GRRVLRPGASGHEDRPAGRPESGMMDGCMNTTAFDRYERGAMASLSAAPCDEPCTLPSRPPDENPPIACDVASCLQSAKCLPHENVIRCEHGLPQPRLERLDCPNSAETVSANEHNVRSTCGGSANVRASPFQATRAA